MNPIATLQIFLLIIAAGFLGIIISHLTRLSYTLVILLLGIGASFWVPALGIETGIRAHNFQDLILFILIPTLIFEAALNLNLKDLNPLLPIIIFSATVGLLISTLICAAIIFFAINYPQAFPWIAALIAGVVISSTDPIAIVNQLKSSSAPRELTTLIEGESLFNDAAAIVLFSVLIGLALGHDSFSAPRTLWQFTKVLLGGMAIGLILALLFSLFLKALTLSTSELTLISIALAYSAFYIAEHIFHFSGVIAVLAAAILFCHACGKYQRSITQGVVRLWETLAFLVNTIVFFLLGLVVTPGMFTERWLAMLVGIFAALTGRALSVYFSFATSNLIFRSTLSPKYPPVMVWGGLKGAVTIALVLSLPIELDYWWTIQSIGFGVVLFSLLVQGSSNPFLLKMLKLK